MWSGSVLSDRLIFLCFLHIFVLFVFISFFFGLFRCQCVIVAAAYASPAFRFFFNFVIFLSMIFKQFSIENTENVCILDFLIFFFYFDILLSTSSFIIWFVTFLLIENDVSDMCTHSDFLISEPWLFLFIQNKSVFFVFLPFPGIWIRRSSVVRRARVHKTCSCISSTTDEGKWKKKIKNKSIRVNDLPIKQCSTGNSASTMCCNVHSCTQRRNSTDHNHPHSHSWIDVSSCDTFNVKEGEKEKI